MLLVWIIVAFLVPPWGLHFGRASRTAMFAVSALWLVGQATFWLYMSGPGFVIALLASLAGVVALMLTRREGRA